MKKVKFLAETGFRIGELLGVDYDGILTMKHICSK